MNTDQNTPDNRTMNTGLFKPTIRINADIALLEAKILWHRSKGTSRAETANHVDLTPDQVSDRQYRALRRYGFTSLDEYRPHQPAVLRALIDAFDQKLQDPRSMLSVRLNAGLAVVWLRHMLANCPPVSAELDGSKPDNRESDNSSA